MPKRIATWNPANGVWQTDTAGLLCGHLAPYLAAWPTSGMTRGGVAYEQPTSGRRMDGSVSSSLLPTPEAYQASRGGAQHPDKRRAGGHAVSLQDVTAHLLPTPTVSDARGTSQGFEDRRQGGPTLNGAVLLLPTPAVNDMGEGKTPEVWDEWTAKMQTKHGNGNGHGKSLAIEAARLSIGEPTSPPYADGSTSPDE